MKYLKQFLIILTISFAGEILHQLLPLPVPLFVGAFRRADELATAMECRCYHGGEGRTRMKQLRFAGIDFAAFALCALLIAAVCVLRHFGL